MDRKNLTRLRKDGVIGGREGIVDTWNWFVDFFQSLKDGFGIEITFNDHVCRIDRSRQAGGENNTQTPKGEGGGGEYNTGIDHVYQDTKIAFGLTPRGAGGYTMRGGVVFLNKAFLVNGCDIDSAGYLIMHIRWNSATGAITGVTYSMENAIGADADFSNGWTATLGESVHEAQIPLYKFSADAVGNISVDVDYIHSNSNMFYFCLDQMIERGEIEVLHDVNWDGFQMQKETYNPFTYMLPKPASGSIPPNIQYATVFRSEIYEV